MLTFYSILFYLLSPLILSALVWRYGLKRTLRGLPERLGYSGPAPVPGVLWVHAASVGEVRAAESFLRELPLRFPGLPRLLTTTTANAKELAERLGLAERVRLAPIDRPGAVRRLLAAYKPRALVLVETELWPHWLRELARAGIPVMVVNGRILDATFGLYYRLRFLWEPLLGTLAKAGVQSPVNASRFLQLGAHPEAVVIAGNLKFDVPPPDQSRRPALRQSYGAGAGPVWVAGSTRPGEEEIILEVFGSLRGQNPGLRLVLAPRHVERAPELLRLASQAGRAALRSKLSEGGAWEILVLDTMGELADIYGLADAAFVGGSLVPQGGQNPLEPARWGVPVLFGPHMENFREVAKLFLDRGAAVQVANASALAQALSQILADPAKKADLGRAAREAADSQRGALQETMKLVSETLVSRPRAARGCGTC